MRLTRLVENRRKQRGSGSYHRGGFTLVELSAVIFIIAVLVSLLCAALNQTKSRALRLTCMDNMRQLQLAWRLYIEDNNDWMPLNQRAWAPPKLFTSFMTSTNSWVSGNPLIDRTTANIMRGTLYPYVDAVSPYRCPMDNSRVIDRPDLLRTRSYAMNAYLGGDPEREPKMKHSEIARPANVFVFIEEHPESIWDSSFIVAPVQRGALSATSATWASTPSDRHEQGCNISFAEGHIEYWRWYAPKTVNPETKLVSNGRDFTDIRRLQAVLPQP